jgi:Lsr2
MAQKTVVELTDDLDGGKAAETVTFGLDGHTYSIDLSTRNARALRKALAPYIESARRVRAARQGRSRARSNGTRNAATRNREVREWARAQGIEIATRGRIPRDLQERFQAAETR